ncbi:acyl carrier protein [Streptomyces virginiae]|uniref:acyl carrier protein n=1 Tax=Streptomyces TaxID=1883 RepID=UPI00136E9B36|nr:acyl carrier protein [Streptomyces sp. SID1046]MYV79172.1 phosphopantetheine attachment site [Streptomyces sp. SID1046]
MADGSRQKGHGHVTIDNGDGLLAVQDHLDELIRARLTGPFSRDVPLVSLGFDSLASIELWSRLRTDLGVDVPAGELLELTLDDLTARVWAEGGSVATSAAGPVAGGPAGADLDDVSPEEAAQLLAALDGLDDAGMERLAAGLGPGSGTSPAD